MLVKGLERRLQSLRRALGRRGGVVELVRQARRHRPQGHEPFALLAQTGELAGAVEHRVDEALEERRRVEVERGEVRRVEFGQAHGRERNAPRAVVRHARKRKEPCHLALADGKRSDLLAALAAGELERAVPAPPGACSPARPARKILPPPPAAARRIAPRTTKSSASGAPTKSVTWEKSALTRPPPPNTGGRTAPQSSPRPPPRRRA